MLDKGDYRRSLRMASQGHSISGMTQAEKGRSGSSVRRALLYEKGEGSRGSRAGIRGKLSELWGESPTY